MNNQKTIEAIVKDGQSFTLGLDASQETKSIVVELEMKARPDSSFAKDLKKFPGKPTAFANVYSENVPLAATGSWNLQKDDKKVFSELVKALDAGLTEAMTKQNLDPTPVAGIVKSLQSTVNSGAVDFFLQFVGEPPGKFVLLGGLKIDLAGDFAAGLLGVLQQLSKLPQIAELEINADSHNGMSLHRLLAKGDGGQGEQRLYGGMPALYIGAGRGAVWFALGREGAAEKLKAAIAQVETVPAQPIPPDKIAPFQMVMNLSSWVGLNPDGKGPVRAAARDAFKPDNDLLRITSRPIENGFRLKFQLDEGFIKYLGIRASERLDRSQL